jgi:hypothetical protein
MALRQLFQLTTGSMNPSYLTGLLAGGAGAATAGIATAPGISAPYIEPNELEVFDVTAPTLLTAVVGATTPAAPAAFGKLLVLDPSNSGPGGWKWKQNAIRYQSVPGGQYGVVSKPASANTLGNFLNGSVGQATAVGNIATPGDKALVVTDGPVPALVTTTTTAISAGMPLAADGAGNLTPINQGLPGNTTNNIQPGSGQVLATSMDFLTTGISTPVLRNVWLGGY